MVNIITDEKFCEEMGKQGKEVGWGYIWYNCPYGKHGNHCVGTWFGRVYNGKIYITERYNYKVVVKEVSY